MATGKSLDALTFDLSVRYSKEHTWVKKENNLAVVGISDYAQDQLGDIIFIELPKPGEAFGQDEVFGFVESAKTSSDLYMPVGGEIAEINEKLEDAPDTVNSDPFRKGWMIKVKLNETEQTGALFDAGAYRKFLQE